MELSSEFREFFTDLFAILALEQEFILHELERVAPQHGANAASQNPAEYYDEYTDGAVAEARGRAAVT